MWWTNFEEISSDCVKPVKVIRSRVNLKIHENTISEVFLKTIINGS